MQKNNKVSELIWIKLGLIPILIAVIGVVTWANYRFSVQNPGGSDFLFGWVATRAFIMNDLNPYSDEVQIEIQNRFYGYQSEKLEEELIFVYPFYSMYIFAPFAMFGDYNVARALWMTSLEIAIVACVLLSLKLVKWKIPAIYAGILIIFSILWYHGIRSIINGNIVVISTLLIITSLVLLEHDYDFWGGALIALSSIKPNVALLLIIFLIIWSLYKKRWLIVAGSFFGITILVLSSVILLPEWIYQNFTQVVSYSQIPTIGSVGAYIVSVLPLYGQQLSILLSICLSICLIVTWKISMIGNFRVFLWAICCTLVISQWIGITTDPGNFILLILPLILILSFADSYRSTLGYMGNISLLMISFFGIWILFLSTLQQESQPMQNPVLFIPFPLMMALGLTIMFWLKVRPSLDR